MNASRRSLQQIYRVRFDVPLLILASLGVLVLGLVLPVLQVRKLVFFEDQFSVLTGLQQMWVERHFALAIVIFFFSVVFPFIKLLMLLGVWLIPQSPARRHNALHWLGILGKWSMLDVFVVALIVLMSKSGSLMKTQPRIGLYVFAAAIALSMLLTMYVHRLARRADALADEVKRENPGQAESI